MDDKKDTKPLPLLMAEFKQTMIDTINNSQLPLCIINEILTNLYREVQEKAKIELDNITG